MQGWKELFQEHILERGRNYFYEGAVTELEQTENGYQAVVEGTEDYDVEIEVQEEEIADMFCSCPYAADGNYCKHMAAVLYKIDEENSKGNVAVDSRTERTRKEEKELEDTIDKIPEKELRSFVKRIAKSDDEIKNLLLTAYALEIDTKQMNRLKQEVDQLVYRYGDRSGFIDYRNAWDFTSALQNFMYEKVETLVDRGYNLQAFEIANYVFGIIGNIDMDDSDGGTTEVAHTCYELWKDILENSSEEEKKKMFQWFTEHLNNGYVIDYMEEYIEDFLMNEFHDRELLEIKLKSLDEIIEKQEASTDCGSLWSAHYGFENNILKRLEIMRELNYSEEEIRQYCKKNWKFSAVRGLEIEESLKEGKTEQAIAILQESKELDREYAGLVGKYSEKLIDLFEKQQTWEAYKKELLFYVFSCGQNDLTYINKLKEICAEQEWNEYREQILKSSKGYQIRYLLMESEGLYERMIQSIQQEHSVHYLDQYEKLLKKKFPEQVRDIYASYVCEQAARVSDRKRYKELMQYLKKIKTYAGGKEKAREIAEDWRTFYYRRSAMMDELRKAGF